MQYNNVILEFEWSWVIEMMLFDVMLNLCIGIVGGIFSSIIVSTTII